MGGLDGAGSMGNGNSVDASARSSAQGGYIGQTTFNFKSKTDWLLPAALGLLAVVIVLKKG